MKLKVEMKMLSLPIENYLDMNTKVVKQTLHQLIDQIEDNELLNIYLQLLERELRKGAATKFFDAKNDELIIRAKASVKSVEGGRTRSITEFKKEVDEWKEKRAI